MNAFVVTRVSTGIGQGVVQTLIEKRFHMCGSVQKESDAKRLRA
jgi:hypothetical protein